MIDRELLEYAAKAAGMQHKWAMGGMYVDSQAGIWNPLTDDGDALRLAVKLRMCVEIGGYGASARIGRGTWSGCETHLHGGIYAATRRAIVRAAAEIGKSLENAND